MIKWKSKLTVFHLIDLGHEQIAGCNYSSIIFLQMKGEL